MMKRFSDLTMLFLCFPAFFLFCAQANAQQVNTDLELKVAFPQINQVIPFGDTVRLSLFIINHGPEDIIGDTLMIRSDNPWLGAGFIGDIPVGDTVTAYGIMQWMGEGEIENDTMNMCYYFQPPVSVSDRVIDTNAVNDTACVSYVMLGEATTGIAASEVYQNLQFFPNPASSWVQVGMNISGYHQLQLSITDIYGRVVFVQEYGRKSLQKNNNIRFDVTGFSPGVYFVRLTADGKTFTNKLIVR